jgi:hypothetical protein
MFGRKENSLSIASVRTGTITAPYMSRFSKAQNSRVCLFKPETLPGV